MSDQQQGQIIMTAEEMVQMAERLKKLPELEKEIARLSKLADRLKYAVEMADKNNIKTAGIMGKSNTDSGSKIKVLNDKIAQLEQRLERNEKDTAQLKRYYKPEKVI